MLDELLDLFERKSSPHSKRQGGGGFRGMLNRLTGKDESPPAADRDRRRDDDDDDRSPRRRKRRELGDFFDEES